MSRFVKGVVITSCILLFTGMLLALLSLALGADPNMVGSRLNNMGVSNVYFWGHDRLYNHSSGDDYDYDYDNNSRFTGIAGTDRPEPPELPESPEPVVPGEYEITSVYFDFEVGDITVTQGDDFALIYGGAQAERYFFESRDGSAWTVGSRKNWGLFDFWRHNGDKLRVTVVLPADFVAERMDIIMGAGNMSVSALYAKELYLDVGVGNCQIGELLAENAVLNVGLGNMNVRSFHAGSSRLEVGMGAMELRLAQPLAQYNCALSVGLGSVTLGKNSYNGVADINTGSGDSPYQMEVNCGMGSITVKESAAASI